MPQLTTSSTVISSRALEHVITREKNNDGAEFTLMSKETRKDFTFSISRSNFKGNWYTHVSVETGYMKFKHLGHYVNGAIIKDKAVVETPSAKAISYVLRKVQQKKFDLLDSQMEVMHLGCCLVCGRPLTDSDSIKEGIGPICRSNVKK